MTGNVETQRRATLESAVDALIRQSAAHAGFDDTRLLRRFVQERDEPAFFAMYQRYYAVLWRMCHRSLGASAADEAFQAVWLIFSRKAHTIRDGQALLGWLIRVCNRVVAKVRRNQDREKQWAARSHAMDIENTSDRATGPERRAELSEIARVVEAEVRELPNACRAVFELSYLEGLGRSDTIRKLGLSELQYDRRIRKARDLLSQRLTRRGITLGAALVGAAMAESAGAAKPISEFARATAELAVEARTLPLQQLKVSAPVLKLVQSVLAPATRHWLAAIAFSLVAAGAVWAAATGATSTEQAVSSTAARKLNPTQFVAQRNYRLMQDSVLPKLRAALRSTMIGNGELTTDRAEIQDHMVYADFTVHHRLSNDNPLQFNSRYQMVYDTMCQRLVLKLDFAGKGSWNEIDLSRPLVLWKDSATEKETIHYPRALREIIAAFEELPFAEEIAAEKTRQWNLQPKPEGKRFAPGSVYSSHGNNRALYIRTSDRTLWTCELSAPDFRWTCIGGCPGEQLAVNDHWLICNYRDRVWVRPADARVHPWREVATQPERVWSFVASNDVLYARRYNGDLLARPIRDWSKPWVYVDNCRDAHLFSDGNRLFEQAGKGATLNWRPAGLSPAKNAPYETNPEAMPVGFAAGGKFWLVREGPNQVPTELLSRPMSPDEQEWKVEARAAQIKGREPKVRLRLE